MLNNIDFILNSWLVSLTVYFIINLVIVLIMAGLANILIPKFYTNEKTCLYECGYNPFTDARINIDIHFYVVSILFILFDIEILFIVPWILHTTNKSVEYYGSMLLFILVFVLGYWFEIKSGTLKWIWSFKR